MGQGTDMKIGKAALWLALGGYIPFGGLTLLIALSGNGSGPTPDFATAMGQAMALASRDMFTTLLLGYAAIILSFLGGIRWGVAMGDEAAKGRIETLALSVLPSLWAWVAAFIGGPTAFLMFAVGFLAMGWWDNKLVASGGAPAWFGTLRMILTGLVTITMLIASFVVRF
ncbi:MAG: DUF3429 domain-containing protein [Pseudomonadota bacterium]